MKNEDLKAIEDLSKEIKNFTNPIKRIEEGQISLCKTVQDILIQAKETNGSVKNLKEFKKDSTEKVEKLIIENAFNKGMVKVIGGILTLIIVPIIVSFLLKALKLI